jgi:sporulation protein YlmC with PRC-barrel domain
MSTSPPSRRPPGQADAQPAESATSGGMRLDLGRPVRGRDGTLGELGDVVVDPGHGRVTHLVVRPQHGEFAPARLVPIGLALLGEQQDVLTLRCTREDFDRLAAVGEVAEVRLGGGPAADPDWDVGVVDVLEPPPYPAGELGATAIPTEVTMIYDRVPKHDIELRRSSAVQASDGGELGHVEALVVGRRGRLTHVVLQRRRFWRRRNVALPAGAIEELRSDLVRLSLSRRQVDALPAERPGRG